MFNIIDIGGTYLKIYDSHTKDIMRIKMSDENVIDLHSLRILIKNNINSHADKIYMSCQMHGFVLFDGVNNVSEFITWKKKSDENHIAKIFDTNYFRDITGLECRNDLPINNIYDFFETNNMNNRKIHVKNISEAILDSNLSCTHITMACGNGFLNIYNNKYCDDFIKLFHERFKIKLQFDDPIDEFIVNGHFNINDRHIPVYCGIGDFQASLMNIRPNELYINMATGSQISILTDCVEKNKTMNHRSFFNKK